MPTSLSQPRIDRVSFLGVRGGTPVPGASTAAFGGNTAAIEIVLDTGRRLYLDAGSGLRNAAPQADEPVDLFLTHAHLGHVVGLPLFNPLGDPARTVRMYGPAGGSGRSAIETALDRLCLPPLGAEPPQATVLVDSVRHGATWSSDGVHVTAFRARHPGETYGYRVRVGVHKIAYFPDNEIVGGDYDVPAHWYDEVVEFVRGADVLIHDAMLTRREYRNRRGRGHSAAEHALGLAHDAAVHRLVLFHHAPWRSDRAILDLARELGHQAAADGSVMDVSAAREGWDVRLS